MANVQESMLKIMGVEGAIGAALVDFNDGLTLATEGGGKRLNVELAGIGNLQVVRAKMKVMEQLGLDDKIEDILITLGKQYHLIRPLERYPNMFFYLAIDRAKGNLGMARHQLADIGGELDV